MTHHKSRDALIPRQGMNRPKPPSTRDVGMSRRPPLQKVPSFGVNCERLDLWGVVVPTARPLSITAGVALASRIATEHDSNLLVLRSGAASRHPFPRALVPRTSGLTAVVDLPDDCAHLLPGWESNSNPVAALHRDSDLGLKRNFGLLIGRMSGPGKALLFLDDDLSPVANDRGVGSSDWLASLRLPDVLADLAASPRLQAAAYVARHFPDNSVVRHARRQTGLTEDVFISGGALVVRIDGPLSVFSAAYNEDWLYFLPLLMREEGNVRAEAVKEIGEIRQDPYEPFQILRAQSEEMGDVLAEGLLVLADLPRENMLTIAISVPYWEQVLARRRSTILNVIDRLHEKRRELPARLRITASAALYAALDIHVREPSVWARHLTEFVASSIADHAVWTDLLTSVTPDSANDALSMEESLEVLGLSDYVTWHSAGDGRHLGPQRRASRAS